MSTLLNDVRFALRIMRKNAGLTIVAVLTLSLGIGATVAIFSILYAVLLRPLPYRDTESLLTIWQTHPTIAEVPIGALDYGDMKQQNNVFSDVAGYTFSGYRAFTVIGAGEPEQLPGALVTINLFPLLGVDPLLGRGFSPEEEADPGSQVVMLSERIWRQRFSADPAAIGRAVDLDGQSFTVIGVLKGSNQFPVSTDLWFPVSQLTEEERTSRVVHALVAVARLKPGVSQQQAQTAQHQLGDLSGSKYVDKSIDEIS